jgi:hypothetical protein
MPLSNKYIIRLRPKKFDSAVNLLTTMEGCSGALLPLQLRFA